MLLVACGSLLATWHPAPVAAGSASANGLTVTKSVAEDPLIGGSVSYRITVKNDTFNGSTKAYNLDIVDDLPPGVSYVSTTSPVAPVVTDLSSNQQRLQFRNLTDLAVNQTFSIDITATLGAQGTRTGIATPNTTLTNSVQAFVSSDPRVTLPNPVPNSVAAPLYSAGATTVDSTALPFKLKKATVQSTGVNQATGGCPVSVGQGRVFGYSLTATNNPLGSTSVATITDTLPFGVVYCGTTSGPVPSTVTVNGNGTTTLIYSLGTLSFNQVVTVTPDVAIPYLYPGTTTVIDDGTVFTNKATLGGTYLATHYDTSEQQSPVTAKYATVDKGDDKTTVDYGDHILYSLKVWTSTDYDINTLYVYDTIPNGQRYDAGSAAISATPFLPTAIPTSIVNPCGGAANVADNTVTGVYVCKDGTTVVTWGPINNTPLTPTVAGSDFTINLSTQQLTNYRDPSTPPVLANDSFENKVEIVYNATNIAAHTTSTGVTNSVTERRDRDSEGQTTKLPTLIKTVEAVTRGDGNPGDGTVAGDHRSATAAVGDIVTFRLVYSGVVGEDQRNIVISDFLPTGYSYLNNTSTFGGTYITGGGTINGVAPAVANPDCAPTCADGSELVYRLTGNGTDNVVPLNRNVTIQFTALVTSAPVGGAKTNLGKFSGSGTSGAAYSGRDQVDVATIGPNLGITKTNTATNPAFGNNQFFYTVTVTNNGSSTAFRVADLIDTLPADITYVGPPTITPAGVVSPVSPVTSTTYGGGDIGGFGGTLTFHFDSTIAIAPGGSIQFRYLAQIRPAPSVGSTQTNTAAIATYNAQPLGVPTLPAAATYGPASASSQVHIGGDLLSKTATVIEPRANGVGGLITIGDRIQYQLTYTIPGNATIYDGQIRDCMPLGFHYVSGSYLGEEALGTLPVGSSALFARNDSHPNFSANGSDPSNCPANQQLLIIPVGTQSNALPTAITLRATLTATITGFDNNSAPTFPNYPAANNTRSNGTTANVNTGYIFAAPTDGGQRAKVATITVPNNGTNNDVFIPHLTLDKTVARTSNPATLTYSVPAPAYPLVREGSTVDYLLRLQNDGGSGAFQIADLLDTFDAPLAYVQAYQSGASCDTAIPLGGVTSPSAQAITIPAPTSLGAGQSLYVCLRVTVGSGTTLSTLYNNKLQVGSGVGAKYFSAPNTPASYPDRAGYTQDQIATATVRTPDLITFPALTNKTYGDGLIPLAATSAINPSYPGRPIDYTVAPGSTCVIVGSAPNFSAQITGAGTCTVIASQRGENLAPDVQQSFTIAKAPLTVKVNDISVPFGAPIASACTLAPNYPTPFVYGETTAVLGGALTCSTTGTPGSTGSFPLTPSGYTSNNYNITYLGARLTITPCQVALGLTMLPAGTIQYSDQLTLRAQVTTCGGNVLPTGPVQFMVDGTIIGSSVLDNTGLAKLPYQVFQTVGSHSITARYATTDSRFYSANGGPAPLTVTQEDATVNYNPARYSFPVNNATKKGSVQLFADVKDITATGGDAFPGDIRTARVRFVNATTGAVIDPACNNLPVALVSTADTKVGTASCTFQSAAATYNIRIEVYGNYVGSFTLTQPVIVGTGGVGNSLPAVSVGELPAAWREEA